VARGPGKGAEVRLEGLLKTYGRVRAVDGVTLTVSGGEFVTLLGPSGSGKTTTLMMVAGFVEPDAGEVFLGGARVTDTPAHRRGLGMVFQHYALFPHMTVFDNIAYPLRMRRVPRAEIRDRVRAALDLVRLPDVGGRYPRQLSGGQQQRIALARALVYQPQVLLMDEPLGALDKKLREEMQVELRTLQQGLGLTALYVTHDQEEAMALSDRVVVMRDGRIEQAGAPDDLYERPRTRFVADFIGASNRLDGEVRREGDAWVFVTAEGARLPVARPPDAAAAGPVQLVLRPERIRWADDGTAEVSASGTVVAVTYLGERIRYLVRLDGGPTLAVTHPNLPAGRRPAAGAAVRLGWDRADATLL
jgi:spermidine/putrescine ABC transporter ATP-binding subunit